MIYQSPTIALEQAQKWAEQIRAELAPLCERIEIAGSIRRARPLVHDLDFVILPKPGMLDVVRARCKKSAVHIFADGPINLLFSVGKNIPIDVFFANAAMSELFGIAAGNFGTLLLCRTGSKQFNAWIAERATRMGGHWNPYRGLTRGGAVVAAETEESIFDALNLRVVLPAEREIEPSEWRLDVLEEKFGCKKKEGNEDARNNIG